MIDRSDLDRIFYLVAVALITAGVYLSSFYSYILFHSLVEIATIAIGFTLFILAWNTRRIVPNGCIHLIGVGYAFAAFIDLFHTLAYKGINVFPHSTANLPTQLWIAARYLQGATLCLAPLFTRRRVNDTATFLGYSGALLGFAVTLATGHFPDCFIEGKGLTPFKVASEYVIIGMIGLALVLFYRRREEFDRQVFLYIVCSLGGTALSELSFTAYLSVYGFSNLLGHLLKLAAFYLIYRALLATGLTHPYLLIFRELKAAEQALRRERELLEERVAERTRELRTSQEKYRVLFQSAYDAVFIHEVLADGTPGPFIEVNDAACNLLGYRREELARLSPLQIDEPERRDKIFSVMQALARNGQAAFETVQVAKDGRKIPVEVSTCLTEIEGKKLIFSLVRDVTQRREAEESLRRLTDLLEERVRERTRELEEKNEELERLNRLFVGRELRMAELKEQLAKLQGSDALEHA
ncbi:MASE3 domain-containing protein [Geomesophilobacter sediminis]|uniref:PAS domain S-box protein n=1 Tax=Geomesophilobacter sediminis TaxID=2798584 RepID=A0A8J7SBG2_9BACT|nr:MASE3 domain-containing protein [Geomesophilobacter sediminis]MBJ6727776.1 PAS domain S-box protein [Geomesophilobacter sediminis]